MPDRSSKSRIVLVTGGTGRVGKGIETFIATDPAAADEHWIYLSSKDGDLTSRAETEVLGTTISKGQCSLVWWGVVGWGVGCCGVVWCACVCVCLRVCVGVCVGVCVCV